MPIDFVLFGLTLTGVAIFHHHTLEVAVSGLAVIIFYQILFSSSRPARASPGWSRICRTSG